MSLSVSVAASRLKIRPQPAASAIDGRDAPTRANVRAPAEQRTLASSAPVGRARQALEIGSQVGRVLISEIAIGLEAFRDDSFQL